MALIGDAAHTVPPAQAQHFSWWMTSMLHLAPGTPDFDRLRQLGELRSVVESEAGRTYLAEAYTGWPLEA